MRCIVENGTNEVMDESRRRDRYEFDKNILVLRCKDVSKSARTKLPFLLTINDISYSGIGMTCQQRLVNGTILIFNLISKMGVREVNLEVMWCKFSDLEFKCGLKFINLTYDDVLFIDEIIRVLK